MNPQQNQPQNQQPDDGFNSVLGPLPAQPINANTTSFADKIAAIGKKPPQQQQPQSPSINDQLSATEAQRAQSMKETAGNYEAGKISLGQAAFNETGQIVGSGFDAANILLQKVGVNLGALGSNPVSSSISDMIANKIMEKPQEAYDTANQFNDKAFQILKQARQTTDPTEKQRLIKIGKGFMDAASQVHTSLAGLDTTLSENAKSAEATGNIGTLAVGAESAPEIKAGLENTVDTTGNAVSGAASKVSDVAGNIKEKFSTNANGLPKNLFHGADAETADSIKSGGFQASNKFPGNGAVNLTTSEEGAKAFAGENGSTLPVKVNADNVKTFNSMDEYTKAIDEAGGTGAQAEAKVMGNNDAVYIKNADGKGNGMVLVKDPGNVSIAQSPADAKNISQIQETIAPKLNMKETQAALDQGRLVRGKDSFLFGKQPDTVLPSDQVVRASQTINENIPGAAKMTDAELTTAINDHIEITSQNLTEDMKNVPVRDETISKMNDTWTKLKAEQATSPEFLDNEIGNKAFQGKFENYLKEAQDAKDLNDVWEARKSYDDSIPRNVKQATEASSPILQTRKAMWLDNRGILNSMINDTATGLGKESQKSFAQMTDMYGAKQNMLSKAKVDLKGTTGGQTGVLGKAKGFITKHPYISGAVGLGAAERIAKGAGF